MVFLFFILMTQCRSVPKVGDSLSSSNFLIFPYVEQKGEDYILIYQLKVPADSIPLVRVVNAIARSDKAFYYFGLPISHQEKGLKVERSIEQDNFTIYARKEAIYWLNSDGSEVKLKIIKH